MEQLFNISDAARTGIKRKYQVTDLIIQLADEVVRVQGMVRFYEDDGSEINYATNPDVTPYPRILRASNKTKVNPANDGTPVYGVETAATYDVDGNELTPYSIVYKDVETNEVVENPIGYFDFFLYVMINVPTIVMDAIAVNVAFEDSIGGLNKKG